jgi:hypothetical protein
MAIKNYFMTNKIFKNHSVGYKLQFLNFVYHNKQLLLFLALHAALVVLNGWFFNYQPLNDSIEYLKRATEFSKLNFFSPSTNYQFAPGYSLFLCLILPITFNNWVLIGLVQAVVFGLASHSLIKTLVSFKIIPASAYIFSMCALLVNPIIISVNCNVYSESLASALVLFSISIFVYTYNSLGSGRLLKLSFVTGLLVITRFEYIVIPLSMAFFVAIKDLQRNALKSFSIILISILLLVANGYRNKFIFGTFRMTSFGGGNVIYGGNNLKKDGSWHSQSNYQTYFPHKYHQPYHDICSIKGNSVYVKLDSLFIEMAKDAWRVSFYEQLKVIPNKWMRTWLIPSLFDIYTNDLKFRKGTLIRDYFQTRTWGKAGVLKHILYLGFHWMVLVTGLFGAFQMFKERKMQNKIFIIYTMSLLTGIMFLFSFVFYGLPRFNAILYPLLVILSAFILEKIYKRYLQIFYKTILPKYCT